MGQKRRPAGRPFPEEFLRNAVFFVEVKQRELRWIETIETIRNWITGKIEMFWMDVLSSEWILGGCTWDLYAFIESTDVNSSCSAGVRCLLLLSGAGKSNELRLWLGTRIWAKSQGPRISDPLLWMVIAHWNALITSWFTHHFTCLLAVSWNNGPPKPSLASP